MDDDDNDSLMLDDDDDDDSQNEYRILMRVLDGLSEINDYEVRKTM